MRNKIIILLLSMSVIQINASELLQPVDLKNIEEQALNYQEDIFLNNNSHVYKLKAEKNIFDSYKGSNRNLYEAKKTSFNKEINLDQLTLGIKTDNTFLPNQYTCIKTFFTRYKLNKMSFQFSYINNSSKMIQNRGKGTFGISPEYRFNEYFAIRTNHLNNFLDKNRKNEILLNIKPLLEEPLDFNIGVGHTTSEIGNKPSSQFRFSTNYKF